MWTEKLSDILGPGDSLDCSKILISFQYGGILYNSLPLTWEVIQEEQVFQNSQIKLVKAVREPETGLVVTLKATVYPHFPAVEWVVYFENTGQEDTPILEDIQPFSAVLPTVEQDPLILHQIVLGQTPHGCKNYPLTPGGVYNVGGIVDSVELLMAPAVRVEDLFVRPDPKTGKIRIQANLRNATTKSMPVFAQFTIAPAANGETLDVTVLQCELPPGDTLVETKLNVQNPRLWELNVPFLYRTTAKVWEEGAGSFDEQSTRCGFRDFRFEGGYFRLNGRRIFLCGPLDLMLYPIGFTVPHDPDFLRRNVLCMKTMGFNICQLVFGGTMARQLDVFDELGVMVYQENYGTWQMQEFQKMEEQFDRALAEIIRRDRNHPSVVIWGLLNETADGRLFRHAVDALPFVRSLDDSRMVMLNSGRWDNDWSIGSLSNSAPSTRMTPGSTGTSWINS